MISSYNFGGITIDSKKFTKDLIISPEKINLGWRRKIGYLLTENDIKGILNYKPEVLIIDTGASGFMKVDDKLTNKLISLGIDLIVKKTPK